MARARGTRHPDHRDRAAPACGFVLARPPPDGIDRGDLTEWPGRDGGVVTADAWITLAVLVVTFGVLAFERLPAAAAMGAAVGVLLLLDVVDQGEALSGSASSAPVTIAALCVLAGAATVTGASRL